MFRELIRKLAVIGCTKCPKCGHRPLTRKLWVIGKYQPSWSIKKCDVCGTYYLWYERSLKELTSADPYGEAYRLVHGKEDDWHFCLECEYDLTGNVTGVCPECGTPVMDWRKMIL